MQDLTFGQFLGIMACLFVLFALFTLMVAGPRWYRTLKTRRLATAMPQGGANYQRSPLAVPERRQVASAPAHAAQLAPVKAADPVVPVVSLIKLADALNIAIIGPKGSGKTTLISKLIALRAGYIEALDPHSEPDKWLCTVVGGGERFDTIHMHLLAAYNVMRQRYAASARGERSQAEYQTPAWSITLAGDEFGGIVGELPDVRATKDRQAVMGAGSLLGKLLARGRKVGLGVITATHDDTAAQFGLEGEYGLLQCFDWLVYLGGQATTNTSIPIEVRQAARRMQRPAVACDTEHRAWYMLDSQKGVSSFSYEAWPMPDDFALAVNLGTQVDDAAIIPSSNADNELQPESSAFQPLQRDVAAASSVAPQVVSPAEIVLITVKLQQGAKPGALAKSLPGYNGRNYQEYKAKVDFVKGLLDSQDLSSAVEEVEADERPITQAA